MSGENGSDAMFIREFVYLGTRLLGPSHNLCKQLWGEISSTFNECKQQLKPLLLIKVKTVVEKSKCVITDKLKIYFLAKQNAENKVVNFQLFLLCNLNYDFSNVLYLKNLQEKAKKVFRFEKLL